MPLADQVMRVLETERQIKQAILSDDRSLLVQADRNYRIQFDKLLNVVPEEANERMLLVDFLLSILKPGMERTPLDQEICNKLTALLKQD